MSTGPDHDRWEDAAGTYVLGAMPGDERAGYEAHLEGCAACRAEVDELAVTVQALPLSAPPLRPPPALKARIMAEVEREAALLAAAGPQADRPRPKRERRRWRSWLPLGMPAVAALTCVALVIGLGAGALIFRTGSGQTVQFTADRSLGANASAELELTGGTATMVARGLPAPKSGRVYMVWLQRAGHAPEPTSALFLPRRDGSATASVAGDLKGVEKVIVNTEPDGGSNTPTSPAVLTATLT
jgi:anti-sigma-K factor RskA